MKNLMKYISVATLMLTMASCESSDELNLSAYESDPNAVKINATIAGMTPQSRVNTEGNGTAWQNNDRIKVTNTNAVSGKNVAYYWYNSYSSTWQMTDASDNTTNPPYMVWADGENTFQAFYPYVSGNTNSFEQFTLPNNQSEKTYLKNADWMTATTTATKTADNKAVDLTFKHELVKVMVNITGYNNQYPASSTPTISDPKFTVPTTPTSLAGGKTVTVKDNYKVIDAYNNADNATFMAVLMPGTYAANGQFFQLKVDGKVLPVNAPANSVLTTGLEAGKAYTFNLTVGKDKAEITGVTIADWGTGETIAGDAETEPAFPDANFIKVLKEAPYNVPVDAKGNINPKEAKTKAKLGAITELNVYSKHISDLSGIEYLTNLTKLICDYNELTSLDISKNTLLENLQCRVNRLTTLDITPLSALSTLWCDRQTSDGTTSQQLTLTLTSAQDAKFTELGETVITNIKD